MVNVLEKTKVCPTCALKNQRLELILKGLLSELGCGTLLVTWNKFNDELMVLVGSTNMCDEFSCFCECE